MKPYGKVLPILVCLILNHFDLYMLFKKNEMPLHAFSFLHKLRHQWTFSEKNISGFPRCFWTQSTHIISESNNHHSRE